MRTFETWSPSSFSSLRIFVQQILTQAKSVSVRAEGKAVRLQHLDSGSYRAEPPGEEDRDLGKLIDRFRFTPEITMSFQLGALSEALAEKDVRRCVGTLPMVDLDVAPKAGQAETFAINLSFRAQ